MTTIKKENAQKFFEWLISLYSINKRFLEDSLDG